MILYFVKARSGSVLTGLIPPRQPIQVFPKVCQSQGQGHKVNFFWYQDKVLPQEIHTCYMKAPSLLDKKVMSKVKFFSKVGQKSRSRSRGKIFWYGEKGLVTRNTHVLYESLISFSSKVIAKVKFTLDRQTDRRTDEQTERQTG